MNNTMTRRIFRSTLLVGVVVLLAALTLVVGVLYSYFGRVQESQLRDELSLAAVGVTQSGEDYLRQLKSDQYRITWVAADGAVLYDTQADASAMENHAQRQEVRQALAYGEGESPAGTAVPCCKRRYTTPSSCRMARCCACPPSA